MSERNKKECVKNEVLVPESDCKNFEIFIKSARSTIRSIERLIHSLHHVVKFCEPVGWFSSFANRNSSKPLVEWVRLGITVESPLSCHISPAIYNDCHLTVLSYYKCLILLESSFTIYPLLASNNANVTILLRCEKHLITTSITSVNYYNNWKYFTCSLFIDHT